MRGGVFGGIRRALRLGVWRRELDDELAHHFHCTVEELERDGLGPEQARAEARRRFGDERRWRRELERIDGAAAAGRRWAVRWEVARHGLGYTVRRMRRSPGLTAGVVLTFALGIGANATMFGIVDRLLLSPPAHVRDADAVVRILVDRHEPFTGTRSTRDVGTYPDYLQLTRTAALQQVAARAQQEVTVGRGPQARAHPAEVVTGNYFSMLGVRPALGRFFGPEEDRVGGAGVAVISHAMWQREFGGRRDVLGRVLDLETGGYTVVGVAPRGFTGVELGSIDLWVPLRVQASAANPMCWNSRNCNWLSVIARLAPGAEPQGVEAEATALYRAGWSDHADRNLVDPQARVVAAPLLAARGPNAPGESRVAVWLAGISLIVLLIACANVANLLLARTVRQRREIGVRLALGSSRARVLGQALGESLLLALLGGAGALLLTRWGGDLLRRVLLPEVAWEATGVEVRVAAVIVLLTIFAGVIAGVVPAVQASRPDVGEALKSGARATADGASRARSALTVVQAALSVVLLVGAGLFVHSLHRVRAMDLGLDPDGVFLVNPTFHRGISDAQQADFYRRATERLGRLPAVEAVSGDVSVPFWSMMAVPLAVRGRDSIPMSGGPPVLHRVDAPYFQLLDLQMRRGRGLLPEDRRGAPLVAVVNETMARVLWPDQDPLGQCLQIGYRPPGADEPPCTEVVGVVENARRFNLVEQEAMQYYLPLAQDENSSRPNALLVRLREGSDATGAIQRELFALGSGLRFVQMQPLRERIAPQSRSWRLGATMFTAFGLLALLVAGIGLYSVLAFGVVQRTTELGIRSALGASRERLMGLVLGQGVRMVAVGIVAGVVIALLAAPRLEPLLFETSARDPRIFGLVAAVLLLVALLASGLPAWRATRVSPSEALRAE